MGLIVHHGCERVSLTSDVIPLRRLSHVFVENLYASLVSSFGVSCSIAMASPDSCCSGFVHAYGTLAHILLFLWDIDAI